MMILDALRLATGEVVVYVLLTAYVETLHHDDETRWVLPPQVTKLPLTGKADVGARLRALGQMAKEGERHQRAVQLVIEEATEIFAAASRRLSVLTVPVVTLGHAASAVTTCKAWAEQAPCLPLPAALLADAGMESRDGAHCASRNSFYGKRTRRGYLRRRIRSAVQ